MSFLTPLSKALSLKDTTTCPAGYHQEGTVNNVEILCCPNGYHQSSPNSLLCSKDGLPLAAYIGIAIAVLVLVAIAIVAFIIRKRRLRAMRNSPVAQYNEKYNPNSFNNNSYQPSYQQSYQNQPSYYVPQTENQYSHPAY